MAQKLIEFFSLEDYFFTVATDSEYNTTGKTELHSLDSIEPIITGELRISTAIIRHKIESILYR